MIRRLKLLILTVSLLFISVNCFALTEYYVDNTLYTADAGTSEGTAIGGGNDWINLAADASGTDDIYNTYGVLIISGTGNAGECRRIIDYDATGNGSGEQYAQVDAAWGVNPDATTVYEITVGSNSNNGLAEGLYGGTNGAWRTIQYACDNIGGNTRRINILSGREYDTLLTIDIDTTGGSQDGVNRLQGYGATVDDHTKAVIDGQSTANDVIYANKGYWVIQDLELKGSTDDGIYFGPAGDSTAAISVKVTTAGDDGMFVNDFAYPFIMGCDITATDCAINTLTVAYYGRILYNYIHDCAIGMFLGSYVFSVAIGNIIETCSGDGIAFSYSDWNLFLNNTIYDCGDDNLDSDGNSDYNALINNIFYDAVGANIEISSTGFISFYANNVLHTSGTASGTYIHCDLGGEVTADPDIAADFTLNSGSPAIDAGYDVDDAGSGVTGSFKWNIGADQDDVAAAGGGDPIGWVSID